ncbi:MAG: IS1634 family transposase [Chitinophagaceae bacterium]
MFVRKKKNKSGVLSVQVIDKSSGSYKLIKTVGSSANESEVEQLVLEAKRWIRQRTGLQEIDFTDYSRHTEYVLNGIEALTVQGSELLLGKLFDEIGFNQIQDALFRQLIIARLCFPASKLKTTDYLSKYQFINVDVQVVYRYLDKLYNTQKEKVQDISYRHTLQVLNHDISIVFYDVTTVYFEAEREDELRKTGFSKDGKHQHPQIVLGLLVSKGGYPLAYEIFEGRKFEGHTMLPIIHAFKEKYKLHKLIIVADAGLLSKENIEQLQTEKYEYILGARIKSENKEMKAKVLALQLENGQSAVIQKNENTKLVVSYSHARATKDAHNRERGIKKLEQHIKSGKLTKSSINNRGYNKFLNIANPVSISINTAKIEEDKKWDGLKGYLTNTQLNKDEIIENYKSLWQIEKAFRIAKTDLKIRPIFHRTKRRIEAHICIAFAAYKIYKELERQLREKQSNLSPEQAIAIAKTIFTIRVKHPISKEVTSRTLLITEEHRQLANLFKF